MNYFFTLLFMLMSFLSCARTVEKAVNNVKYSAWESIGVEKRDLFKRNVANVKEEQEETGEAFKDALTRLQELYRVEGGKLEKEYKKLQSSYQNAREESGEISQSIEKLDTVANDLFDEWRSEIAEIKTKDLRKKSKEQLSQTKNKYEALHKQLRQSEKKMEPILERLNDQVLFLKHNLNAQAIGGLKTESSRIQSDIEKLMKEMKEASQEADELIESL